MRRLLSVLSCLGLGLLAQTPPLALIILSIPSSPVGRLPQGWTIKVNHGAPDIATNSGPEGSYVRLRSHKSSFALERGVDVDVAQYPYLTWRWKVDTLPRGGDFRHAGTDDQAAQILVAFQDRRILSYIWDSSAPKGTSQSASSIPLLHIFAFVCRSGGEELNRWVSESRNLAADYQIAYARRAPRVKGIRIQINSQHTGTSAESDFAEVAFRSAPE